MFCSRCGAHNDDNAWRCVNCQEELHAHSQPAPLPFQPEAPKTSMKAIISIACGIIGLCCCNLALGPIAIVLGILARNEIKGNPESYRGESLAIMGIVLGVMDILMGIIGMIILEYLRREGYTFPFQI